MIPRPARYLLRFDGLCPTMSRPNWDRIQAIVDEFNIRPILSVIPDNRDNRLLIESPDPEFWDLMRSMETSWFRHRAATVIGIYATVPIAG